MAVFRVEKTKDFTIMSNHHLRNAKLSLKAKGLLSLMLSLPESWDYTTKGLAHICKDGVDSISTALKELEQQGYLTRQRIRYGNGQLGDIEYTIHESPVSGSVESTPPKPGQLKQASPEQEKPRQVKPGQAEPEQGKPAQLNTYPSKTEEEKTHGSSTDPSIPPVEPDAVPQGTDEMDRMDLVSAYREIIKANVQFDSMAQRYGLERMTETVELILETVLAQRPYIRIAGDMYPKEVVKSRFLKLNCFHLEYVFDSMDRNGAKIANIKAYLLTALYNAPATMENYYTAEASYENHGCTYAPPGAFSLPKGGIPDESNVPI